MGDLNNDSGVQKGAKGITSTAGNLVGGLTNTVGKTVGTLTKGTGDTVNDTTGSKEKPGEPLSQIGQGVEKGGNKVADTVKDAGNWEMK